jgi:hypothetical protein
LALAASHAHGQQLTQGKELVDSCSAATPASVSTGLRLGAQQAYASAFQLAHLALMVCTAVQPLGGAGNAAFLTTTQK